MKNATRRWARAAWAIALVLSGLQTASAQQAGSLAGFKTPSDNIHCMLDDLEPSSVNLRCDIREVDSLPPMPRSCDADYGHAFAILANGQQGERWCVGDTVYDPSHPVLQYGDVWQDRGFTCRSEQSGLTCFNAQQHGFKLSRSVQKLF